MNADGTLGNGWNGRVITWVIIRVITRVHGLVCNFKLQAASSCECVFVCVLCALLSESDADVLWSRDDVSEVRWMDSTSALSDSGTSFTILAANVVATSLLHSDFSGDGVSDLIIGGRSGIATRRGVATTDPLRVIDTWFTRDTDYGNAVDMSYGDLDRDGDTDLFVIWGGKIVVPAIFMQLHHTSCAVSLLLECSLLACFSC